MSGYRADRAVTVEIEQVARAICAAMGEPPDFPEYPFHHWLDGIRRPCWKKYIEAAEAAAAVLAKA